MRVRLNEALSVLLVLLALSPFTAPFSTYDPTGRHDLSTAQAEIVAAKASLDQGTVLLGVAPTAPQVAPVFVLIVCASRTDEVSKHQIPSRILRL